MVSTRTKKDVTHSLWDAPYWQPFRVIARSFSGFWIACIPLAAIITIVWNKAVVAQNAEIKILEITEATPEAIIQLQGTLNAIWVLIAAILVIFMNAGFGMLETGFCRQKNAVNILTKNLIVFALATIAYWAIGFSLMFGGTNAIIGSGGWFLASQDPATYNLTPFPVGLPISVFFLFQVAFAGTAATIVSGAVAERIKFVDFLVFSLILVGIAYPITGHWVWGGGWLGSLGFKDFAGSSVVHSVGGWAALVGAAVLGPRMGKYVDGRPQAIPGHNMSIATLGCLILWIGWFGFNPGSQLAADSHVPYIAVTTNLAGAMGGIVALFVSWAKDKKPDLSMVINGILAGLVGITAGCEGVSYWGAVIIGAVAGVLVVYAVGFIDGVLKIDDPVGAISVHLVNGIWGTFAVGLFNQEVGLFYGHGIGQLINQIIGIVAIGLFTIVFSVAVWTALKATLGIRVSREEEIQGLDIGEHGMEAYHGFVKEPDGFAGMGSSSVNESDVSTGAKM
ncbi:ammonium transporter [Crocosphaera sp. XPORK-15E]|uniref:ammonium transporter n=1 Tax=Crocosphaera sp. XPORK-15E TaxID=3110247 RepID=UPI002B21DFC9|nr:ammonium transporter [Crocosphaera sp. XPORK-15E]MEA5536710.1 ammonium transporter [Crocosphaera sp. XPORK-15E]